MSNIINESKKLLKDIELTKKQIVISLKEMAISGKLSKLPKLIKTADTVSVGIEGFTLKSKEGKEFSLPWEKVRNRNLVWTAKQNGLNTDLFQLLLEKEELYVMQVGSEMTSVAPNVEAPLTNKVKVADARGKIHECQSINKHGFVLPASKKESGVFYTQSWQSSPLGSLIYVYNQLTHSPKKKAK